MLKKKELAVICLLMLLGATAYVAGAIKVQALRDRLDPTQIVSALQIEPEVLAIIGGEFRSLLADYLLLKASVYLGGREETTDTKKKAVSTLFRQSAALDPYFFQTCFLVQGYLPWWRGEMLKDGLEILEIFNEHRDWDWEPGYYIGFDYFYFLRDNKTASRYLMDASQRPNTSPFLGLLGARLSQKGGQTQASIEFLKTMHAGTENKRVKEQIERRIEAFKGILVLEKAIRQFRSMFFNRPPDKLDQLVEAGVLKELPKNPARNDGLFIYKDGQLDF